jgi:hypothetical protein
MRRIARYSLLEHRRNEDILDDFKVQPVQKKLAQYKQKLLNYVSRMVDIRHPKQLFDCGPTETHDDLDNHEIYYWMDTILRPKQVIYWPNFVTKRISGRP